MPMAMRLPVVPSSPMTMKMVSIREEAMLRVDEGLFG